MNVQPNMKLVAGCLVLLILLMAGCATKKSISDMTAAELFDHGKEAYDKEKYLKAIDLFQSCIYNYPGRTIVDTAQYYLALSYFGNQEYQVAEVEFNRLVSNYPSSVYFEHAVFMRAICSFEAAPDHYGLDQTELETALRRLDDFIIDFPESPLVADAQTYATAGRDRLAKKFYEAGVVYSRMGAHTAAKVYFQKVVDNYTDGEYGPLATFMLAEQSWYMKEYDDAQAKYDGFVAVFPDHELVPKAAGRAQKSVLKAASLLVEQEAYEEARTRLEQFQTAYPGSEKADQARELLDQINQAVQAAPAADVQS